MTQVLIVVICKSIHRAVARYYTWNIYYNNNLTIHLQEMGLYAI
jgi:hypothetical protein